MSLLQARFEVRFRYPVHFTADVFGAGSPLLARIVREACTELPAPVLFVLDRGLCERNPALVDAIQSCCRRHLDAFALAGPPLLLPGGEAAKNDARHVDWLRDAINQAGLCRHSFVIAVGGGAVTDVAGFAAATAHRGIRLIRIPTTVLAQNDAAIGVKNGINAFGKKNWLGTFAPPHAVINDFTFLRTLSDRDWRAGTAEAVKVAVIKDPTFFAYLERRAPTLAARDMAAMRVLIRRCAELHIQHIATSGDPFELGSARPLDFGHWAAHRLERLTAHRLRHGEAVAIGIALDSTYSRLAGFLASGPWRRILATLRTLGFALHAPELCEETALIEGLDEFRQHLGGRLTITLLRGIGEGFEVHEVDRELLRKSIAFLQRMRTTEAVQSLTKEGKHESGSRAQPADQAAVGR